MGHIDQEDDALPAADTGGNYLFPLLLLPFPGRVPGVTEFGVLAYCQAVVQYLILLGNLGLLALGRTRALKNVYAGVTVLHLIYVVPLTLYLGAEGTIVSVILTELFGAVAFAWLYLREVRPPAHARAQG
jgi:O-antigen/teichoic acid export membrane protein